MSEIVMWWVKVSVLGVALLTVLSIPAALFLGRLLRWQWEQDEHRNESVG